jgi:hypothetical protein
MSQLQRLGCNFDDGVTMHLHLENLRALITVFHPDFYRFICSSDIVSMFFAYRWLLLDFKREFSFKDTLVLWETLWAQFTTNHTAIFLALAIIEVYGLPVIAKARSSDYVLEYFNGLALHMDLHVVLRTMRAVSIAPVFVLFVSKQTRLSSEVRFSVFFACGPGSWGRECPLQ